MTIDAKVQKEIRPVFHEELDFFGMDAYWDYPKDTDAPLMWAEGIRRYVMNGVCVAEAQGGGFYTKPVINRLTEERLQLHPIDTGRLYEVNKALMLSLEQKAVTFIQEQHEHYASEGFSFVCAFSGGKDSLVLLALCAKALAPEDFYVVFSNTGMELSDTLKAVEEAKKHWPQLRFEEAKCHMEPTESWAEFGPPGRRMRWCCSVHKSVPTILKLRELLGKYNAKAVVYDGVRAEESARRAKYDDVSEGAKNSSQVNASPILKWNSAELFVFIFHEEIMLNRVYRYGANRVGCTVCPLSAPWRDSITNAVYPEDTKPLLNAIENITKSSKIKDFHSYMEANGWRTRMGGRDLINGGNRVYETVVKNHFILSFHAAQQNWLEVSKLLGVIVESTSTLSIQRIGKTNYEVRYTYDTNESMVTVDYYPFSAMDRFVINHIRGVANKVAYCIGCKACMVQCPVGAFVINNGRILIREDKCIHCSKCISFIDKGCLVAKSLSTTMGGSGMDMKGMNRYQTFGLRRAWLEHFIEAEKEGKNCFQMGVLGNRQYDSLKKWLQESELVDKDGNGSTLTPLGEKILRMNPYNPFVWAVIWAHLAYNSVICKWYMLNAELGATYDKGYLVELIGDSYAQRTRENAIASLCDLLKESPIGSALQQGIAMEQGKNTYSYLRAGWEMPHAVALLYALYLYAEHTGRRSFTFSELVSAKNNPDATGMSPSDIYGIDVKAFREQIQGLAISFPKYIRVSFISNLDNIILEDFSSLDILDLAEE